MPNYEYQCTKCPNLFEIWQSVGEEAPPCPECGGTVKKVFHPPRVIFKGSGFYVTDLRAEKAGNTKPDANTTASIPSSSASSSSNSKSSETSSSVKGETKSGESTSAPAAAPSAGSSSDDKAAS